MPHKINWHKQISSIPRIQQAGLLDWEVMPTGSSNQNFKISTQQGLWILRLNQSTLGINRQQEQCILELIEPLSIMPKVISNQPSDTPSIPAHLITEFIPQATWQSNDFKKPESLQKLCQKLKQFHDIPYQYLPSRLDNRLRTYLKHIQGVPKQLQSTLLNAITDLEKHGFWQTNTTLYHSDLNPSNLVGHEPLHIIDWEYAGQGHPLLDWLILEHYAATDLSQHHPKDLHEEWLKPAKTMIDAMMKLWSFHRA